MSIFLGYQTGVDLWRWPEVWSRTGFLTAESVEVPSDAGGTWRVDGTSSTFWRDAHERVDHPWDLVTSRSGHRGRSATARWHVRSHELPAHSGLLVDDGIYLASPELCLLQMAEGLPLAKLIELMDEFCGTYLVRDELAGGGLVVRPPLTSTTSIGRYLRDSEGVRGVKRARRALGFVVDGSASPKETHAEMLACLPNHLGGHMLEKARMNQRFDVPRDLRGPGVSSYYECDLCWPVLVEGGKTHHVAIEYQSTDFHEGAAKLAEDSRRRNVLEALGVHVITLTAAELYSPSRFEQVVRLVAQATGQRLRPSSQDFARRRDDLRNLLLGEKKQ